MFMIVGDSTEVIVRLSRLLASISNVTKTLDPVTLKIVCCTCIT